MRMLTRLSPVALALLLSLPSWAETLLVLNRADSEAALIDTSSYQVVARLPLGKNPHEIATSPDGRYAYAGSYGGNTVTVLDLERQAVKTTFVLGSYTKLHGISASRDGSRVWVTAEEQQAVLELDAQRGNIVKVWKTGQEISHMLAGTPDDRKLYVANIGSGSVTIIDRVSGDSDIIPTGAGAEGIAVSPDGREVWVSNNRANTISVIDVASDHVVTEFSSQGRFPVKVRFTPDGKQVWVSNNQSGTVAVFNAHTRELLDTIKVGTRPLGLLFSPDSRRAFVTMPASSGAVEIDLVTRKVVRHFETGASPDGMAWAAGANRSQQLFEFVPVAEGVYAALEKERVRGLFTANSVVIVNRNDVLVVDGDGWPSKARALLARIRTLTHKPIRTVVNTHFGPDHCQANQVYQDAFPGVEIIAHPATRQDLANHGVEFQKQQLASLPERIGNVEKELNAGVDEAGDPLSPEENQRLRRHLGWLRSYARDLEQLEIRLPTLTFDSRLILHRGDRPIHLLFFYGGHSPGDVVVYLPQEKAAIVGDLVMSDRTLPGRYFPVQYVQSLKELAQLDFDHLIPGHGPLLRGKDYLHRMVDLAESLVNQVQGAVQRGLSLEETQAVVELGGLRAGFVALDPQLGAHFDRETTRAIENAYRELAGAAND